ncbi:C-glycoside deglycosidase beta subunit domain-containing protein [Microbacterium sp. 22215]|uniref:C-glycoside deglycosidase beta subunit domain-containing protein n=1 Tax=Microbacterium sp. 22215 TaxID=3453893 RepID=UPI003F85F01A
MSLKNGLLGAAALQSEPDGIRLNVQIPWYRSLPLSCIEGVTVHLDGAPLDLNEARLLLNDKSFPLGEFGSHVDEVWFIQDSGGIHVPGVDIAPGSVHDVTVRMDMRIPYIIVGPEKALPNSVTVTKQLTAK